ncbi:MAG: class I SAM-dependent methyltransferase [Anaerolineae bacterium]
MIDYDKIAREYAQHRQLHPGVLEALLAAGGIDAASQVLEVGCGTGNYIIALNALAGCACWGLDPSQEMLARAQNRSDAIDFQQGRAEALDFAANSFDLVFSVDVIHHVERHPAYFREAHRVLKPGRKLCTVTDSEWIIRHRQPLAAYFPETVEVELRRYPRIAVLRDLAARAGFRQITPETVELPYSLTDIQPYRDRAFSALHVIPAEAFRRGLDRMERDLQSGPIPAVSRYLLLWAAKD